MIFIILLGFFLRIYKLSEWMPFIGDYGWFYLSARDLVLYHKIPLVGITSSHTWLHQGPLWTYMLAILFFVSKFNPVMPAYLTAFLGTLTIWLVYKLGSILFSKRTGIIAALLCSTSPLIAMSDRTPYHTSIIPLFTALFIYSMCKWLKGNLYFFPLSILCLSILYNLELATAILWLVISSFLFYGVLKHKMWGIKIFSPKIIFLSIFSFIIPMIPILIYDTSHSFVQTGRFALWTIYRAFSFLGYSGKHTISVGSLKDITDFLLTSYSRLIFASNSAIFLIILTFTIIFFFYQIYLQVTGKTKNKNMLIILLMISFPLVGYFITQTPSEAYLPILFCPIIIFTAILFDHLLNFNKLKFIIYITIVLLVGFNMSFLIKNNYLTGVGYQPTITDRINIVKKIIKESDSKSYNIIGKGEGSQFESFTMHYEYLAWWFGKVPSKRDEKLKFYISENRGEINVQDKIK